MTTPTRPRVIEVRPEGTYVTTDLYFSAFLSARGIPLLTTTPGTRCSFIFEDRAEIEALKYAWFNGQNDEIRATKFAEKVRQLKALAVRRA